MKNKNQRTYKDDTDEILSMKKKSFCKVIYRWNTFVKKRKKKVFQNIK